MSFDVFDPFDPFTGGGGSGSASLPALTLTWRQRQLYLHRCTLWRQSETFGALGKPGHLNWSRLRLDIPCYFEPGQSQQGPDGFIFDESDNLFTLDKIHCPAALDVQVSDVIEQTAGPEAGNFWVLRGNPQYHTRRANKLMILASRMPLPPWGVSAS